MFILRKGIQNLTPTLENKTMETNLPIEIPIIIYETSTPVLFPLATETLNIKNSSTLTPTPTMIWTPLPTLEKEEMSNAIHQLLVTNGNCELPCWFGMYVGEPNFNQVISNLDSLGIKEYTYEEEVLLNNEKISRYSNYYEFQEDEDYLNWNVKGVKNKISQIRIGTNFLEQFSLPSLLKALGTPEEIYLITASDVPGYPQFEPYLPFSLVLYFREKNLLIQYYLEGQYDGTQIVACFEKPQIIINIWEPSLVTDNFDNYLLNVAGGDFDDGKENLKDLFSVTNFTPESFLEFYINEENNCIKTPAEYWSVF